MKQILATSLAIFVMLAIASMASGQEKVIPQPEPKPLDRSMTYEKRIEHGFGQVQEPRWAGDKPQWMRQSQNNENNRGPQLQGPPQRGPRGPMFRGGQPEGSRGPMFRGGQPGGPRGPMFRGGPDKNKLGNKCKCQCHKGGKGKNGKNGKGGKHSFRGNR